MAPGSHYLHLACHGEYGWRNPVDSALILANRDPLTLDEIISDLDLATTRLVVLSACETGIAEHQRYSEEFVGLPAGFLEGGAAGVVSTLWAVPDASTALLMGRFYEAHIQEGLHPAPALATAQRWLRDAAASDMRLEQAWERVYEDSGRTSGKALQAMIYFREHPAVRPFEHPLYWAGFVFTGS